MLNINQEITYRTITEIPELHEAVQLQLTTWGQESVTSMAQMAAAILHGGVVFGAFEGSRMVGFCYGFAGFKGGDVREAYVGSHMMAIHPDYRDRGIGMNLKLKQREWAMEYGYAKIVWTFDPFETRNAYLNLCKLGGTVSQYIPSFYGKDKLQLPSDRFVVEWELASERVVSSIEQLESRAGEKSASASSFSAYPSLLTCDRDGERFTEVRRSEVNFENVLRAQAKDGYEVKAGVDSGLGGGYGDSGISGFSGKASGFLIPVPSSAHQLKNEQTELFIHWQSELRQLCTEAFACGYRVVSFIRDEAPVNYYVLESGAKR
ncbi:GNAT family N-acetyltransferase [Paenibacillus eucommiae]|uniref:GNAT superfamily acetyltransferase n=1 Tax=Paenibacillus eucommiae TaxID=1355755 RepID=A0ABS4J1X4_9BACL|nr:GNAT family N-acetyltransferase [Paenibacillus eucommiae]MBP1993795.1 putative GNAT superfamily acetyltransferase [Paenibacillus eucommiae]